ncbi:MAG: DMT family transporter [Phreatobacter sp.]
MTPLTLTAATPDANRRGIIAMLGAMAFFVTNDTLVKIVAADLPSGQLIAIRGVFATTLVLAWIAASGHLPAIGRILSPLVLGRAVSEATVAFLFISALKSMPIGDITAISLITPLVITALSVPLLGETVGWRRGLAVVAGFIGMLFVVRPTGAGFSAGFATTLALVSVLFCALRDLVTRFIDPTIPTLVITLSTCIAVGLFGAAIVPFQGWVTPSWQHIGLLGAASVVLVIGNFCMIQAFRGVEVSLVSPFRYSVMIWALLSGIVVFGDWPNWASWLGMAIIIVSGLYTLHRETIRLSRPISAAEATVRTPPS